MFSYFFRKLVDLLNAKPLNLFKNVHFNEEKSMSKMTTWKKLYQRELELTVTLPPANGFQQMILWTRQGKLWQFPINNEQGYNLGGSLWMF